MLKKFDIQRINVDPRNNPVVESNFGEEPPIPQECIDFTPSLDNRLVFQSGTFPDQPISIDDRTNYGICESFFSTSYQWFIIPASSSDAPIYTQSTIPSISSASLSYAEEATGLGIQLFNGDGDTIVCSVKGPSAIRFNWNHISDTSKLVKDPAIIDLGLTETDIGGEDFSEIVEEVYNEGEFSMSLNYDPLSPTNPISIVLQNATFLENIQYSWILLHDPSENPIYSQPSQPSISSASLLYEESFPGSGTLFFDGNDNVETEISGTVSLEQLRFDWYKVSQQSAIRIQSRCEEI